MDTDCVWQTFDQETLDREYSAVRTVPTPDPYFERWENESARVRAALECRVDVPYGPGKRERLDVFPAVRPEAPVLVVLHGGYWRRFSKNEYDFFVEPFVQAGAAAVVPSYTLVPEATLDDMLREMREVIVWIHESISASNGDPLQVVVAGHSAGGQLGGLLAATDWEGLGLPRNPIVGLCGISGLYDLEPVQRSNVNDWLRIDTEGARRNSPMFHLPQVPIPLVAAVGERETSEFQRQTLDFAVAWRELGYPAECLVMPGLNHFNIVLDVQNEDSRLRAEILRLLRLT